MDSRARLATLLLVGILTTFAFVAIGSLALAGAGLSSKAGETVLMTVGICALGLSACAAAASLYLVGLYGRFLRDHARMEHGLATGGALTSKVTSPRKRAAQD